MRTDKVRSYLHMTQAGFAEFLCVDVRKVQNWDARGTWPEWADKLVMLYIVPLYHIREEWLSLPEEVKNDMPFSAEMFDDPEDVQMTQVLGFNCGVHDGNVIFVKLDDLRCSVYQRDIESGGWIYKPFGLPEKEFVAGIRSGSVMFR